MTTARKPPSVFLLGNVTLKNPTGAYYIYLIGGIWSCDRIKNVSIYVSKTLTNEPNKDGKNIVHKITIERDDVTGAFSNNCGIPTEIRSLIKKKTTVLFEK
ncbi:hypothetical protein A2V49_02995 [candidate division WWE3 bacterium RBG_19FT_COMBO_34_6]|uniref:Uncharacterized protein n=1 Tax=candidate division WWE3 bacterium RBG_19FT_COMBO_34_6 TaxID=1802612 RepID=A0A1F4UL24_UNCKA|nr:MAG: hypothetical protein A2V49_02995 [candidate division WWE3 bacterium RBG_19FT_COMBO_34_6]